MGEQGQGRSAGVGVAYHPFLHDALLARRGHYDFVSLPLEGYLGEVPRALLDPKLERLRAVAATAPTAWRGRVHPSGVDPAWATERAAALVREAGATRVRDTAAVNPPDDPAPARDGGPWGSIERLVEAAPRLGVPVLACLPLPALLEPSSRASAVAFGRRLAEASGGGLGVDVAAADLGVDPAAAGRALAALPPGSVSEATLRTQHPRAWPLLCAVLAATGAAAVTVHRTRRFFPLEEVFVDLDRARACLSGGADGGAPGLPDTGEGAAAWDAPPVPAGLGIEAHRVWREGVAAVNSGRQLARWAERGRAERGRAGRAGQ